MTVVRELVAKFGVDFDQKGVNEASKGMDKLTGKAKGATTGVEGLSKGFMALGGILSAGAIVVGLKKIVTAASDANEVSNLLKENFGEEGKKQVESWSESFGKEAGRSKWAMQDLAGTIGAVLNPMMEGNKEAAGTMSQSLAGLAVDLGSFFNAADTDVLQALRAGITGEAEPLKRFGIVMSQAALESFALSQGITENVKDMSTAAKTQLRYNFIMANTKTAQGDAARTADGFANMSKRLRGQLQDVAVSAGKTLLPALEKIMKVVGKVFGAFSRLAENGNVVKGMTVGLGVALVALGVVAAASMAPALLAFGKLALVVTAVSLVATDLFTLFSGGESVIGRLIESIFGPGSATEAVVFMKDAWASLVEVFSGYVLPYLKFVAAYWGTIISVMWTFLKGPLRVLGFQMKVVFGLFKAVFGLMQKYGLPAFNNLAEGFKTVASAIKKYLQPVLDVLNAAFDKVLGALDRAGNFASKGFGLFEDTPPSVPAPSGAGAGGGGNAPPVINQQNTVNVNGDVSPGTAAGLSKQMGKDAGAGTKKALNALTQKGGA